jgi:hypothetical protein
MARTPIMPTRMFRRILDRHLSVDHTHPLLSLHQLQNSLGHTPKRKVRIRMSILLLRCCCPYSNLNIWSSPLLLLRRRCCPQ